MQLAVRQLNPVLQLRENVQRQAANWNDQYAKAAAACQSILPSGLTGSETYKEELLKSASTAFTVKFLNKKVRVLVNTSHNLSLLTAFAPFL